MKVRCKHAAPNDSHGNAANAQSKTHLHKHLPNTIAHKSQTTLTAFNTLAGDNSTTTQRNLKSGEEELEVLLRGPPISPPQERPLAQKSGAHRRHVDSANGPKRLDIGRAGLCLNRM
eukprot:3704431-Pleurochrysis_carterae.AAC.1